MEDDVFAETVADVFAVAYHLNLYYPARNAAGRFGGDRDGRFCGHRLGGD